MRIKKTRFQLYLPKSLYDRLDYDSSKYGIAKTTIVQNALVAYYRSVDLGEIEHCEKPEH